MMSNRRPLHIALAISVSLHLGVGVNMLVTVVPTKQPISQTDRLAVFKTYMTSRLLVNSPQLEQKKVNAVETPLALPQDKAQAGVDTSTPTDNMEYRRSYSMFGRPRLKAMRQPLFSNGTLHFKENLNSLHPHPACKGHAP
jgi:hypothetical protein